MRIVFAIAASMLASALLPTSSAWAQAGKPEQAGMMGGNQMGGGHTGGEGMMGGGGMMGHGGGMGGEGTMGGHGGGMGGEGMMGGMMSGQMMATKSRQMAAMGDMMRSMGQALEAQAHSMKGADMKARRDAMMKIAKDAESSAATMHRMSSEMGRLHDMGAMQMVPPAAEMMSKSMASQERASEMMQEEAKGGPSR